MVSNFESGPGPINDLTPYANIVIKEDDPVNFEISGLDGGGFGPASSEDLDTALGGEATMSEQSRAAISSEVARLKGDELDRKNFEDKVNAGLTRVAVGGSLSRAELDGPELDDVGNVYTQ